MDGGPQVLKMPGARVLDLGDPMEGGSSPRLPTLNTDGRLVSPAKVTDPPASPPASLAARDHRDLRIGLPKISDSSSRSSGDDRRRRLPPRPRSFMPTPRTVDDPERDFNPDPVPFSSQVFKDPLRQVRVFGSSVSGSEDGVSLTSAVAIYNKLANHRSSTMVKKVPAQGRNLPMWGSSSAPDTAPRAKGYIVHTERYKWDEVYTSPDEFTQRGRMQLEMDYVNRLRSIRRRRDIIPHRETLQFMMGGHQAEMNERDDVMQELKKLKGISLPTAARDLYVGRGVSNSLPKDHALNKPRQSINYNQLLPLQNALDRAREKGRPSNPHDSRVKSEFPSEPQNTRPVPQQMPTHVPKMDASDSNFVMEASGVPIKPQSDDKSGNSGKENLKPPKLNPSPKVHSEQNAGLTFIADVFTHI